MFAAVLGTYFCLRFDCWFLSTISSLVGVGVLSESLMLVFAMLISFGMSSVAIGERFEVLVLVFLFFLFVLWCCNNLQSIVLSVCCHLFWLWISVVVRCCLCHWSCRVGDVCVGCGCVKGLVDSSC